MTSRGHQQQRKQYGPLGPACSISLDEKDLIINRLRHQLKAMAVSMHDHENMLERRQHLEEAVENLLSHKSKSFNDREQQTTSIERTAQNLRKEIDPLQREVNKKSLELNDLLTEADSLAEYYHTREEQIEQHRLRCEDLNSIIENTDIEANRLSASKQFCKSQLDQITSQYNSLKVSNESTLKKLYDMREEVQNQRLPTERLENMIGQYEHENNDIDRHIRSLIETQNSNSSKIKTIQNNLQQTQVENLELNSLSQKLQTEFRHRQQDLKQQRQKYVELDSIEKAMLSDLSMLEKHTEQQVQETNFLLRRNGEIVHLNQQLKLDLHRCQKHMQTIKKTNAKLVESVERFKVQDANIAQKIQSRGFSPVQERKLTGSRLTRASSHANLEILM